MKDQLVQLLVLFSSDESVQAQWFPRLQQTVGIDLGNEYYESASARFLATALLCDDLEANISWIPKPGVDKYDLLRVRAHELSCLLWCLMELNFTYPWLFCHPTEEEYPPAIHQYYKLWAIVSRLSGDLLKEVGVARCELRSFEEVVGPYLTYDV